MPNIAGLLQFLTEAAIRKIKEGVTFHHYSWIASYGGPISAPDVSSECCRLSFVLSLVLNDNGYISFSDPPQIKAGPSKGVTGVFS